MSRRVVAVDLGTRRIGVAVTDGLGLTAQPLATLARHGGERDLQAIGAVVRTYDAARVVLGLPLGPDGEVGRPARAAQAFAERLRAFLGLPVELIDESFTTVEAEEVLLAADLSRARRKQVVDRVAAALILGRWLAARSAPAPAAAPAGDRGAEAARPRDSD
jgi:putative Holliday junction resolvase